MYIRNNTIAVIFRVIFIIVCGAGLVLRFMSITPSADMILGDFAVISNALALVYFAYLIIARPGYERGTLRGAVTIYMAVTFAVYYLMTFGTGFSLPVDLSVSGYLMYFISPVMVFLDYLLFCRKGGFTPYSPVIWAILPVVFNAAVLVVNHMGLSMKRLPYFSLPDIGMVVTLFVFLGISYIFFVIDDLMAGRRG